METYFRFRLIVNEVLGRQNKPSLFVVDGQETFFVLRSLYHQTLFDDVAVVYFIFTGYHYGHPTRQKSYCFKINTKV